MGKGVTLLAVGAVASLGVFSAEASASRADQASRIAEDCPEKRAQENDQVKAAKPLIPRPKKRRFILM